mgnify:FL=1
MTRLRQQYPQNYGSSGNISTEFENITRYLNSAELGDKTVGELLGTIFDTAGTWKGPIEMQLDSSAGIQYRVGTYSDTTTGWTTIVPLSSLKGADGTTVGSIGSPIMHTRVDALATSSQTAFPYAHESTDELLVYVNGVLKRSGSSYDYQTSSTNNTVTFNSGLSTGTLVTIYKIRATSITGFTRTDTVTSSSQNVFNFVHDSDTVLQVYKNGILQREGGSFDYLSSASNNSVTFNSAIASGNTVTIVTVENTSAQVVTGMMFESQFVDSTTGFIDFGKITVTNNEIAQVKVSGLTTALSGKANLTVASSTPGSPSTGDLYMDTSQTPNVLKFYDGSQFLQTSPDSSLPTFLTANAGQFVKVNGSGTALIYGAIDLSSVLAVTTRGAANGVASLDSTGRLPTAQLPVSVASESIYHTVATTANQTYTIKRIFKQKIQINGLSLQTTSGTCSLQLSVNGVAVGSTYSVSSSINEFALGTVIEVDATTASKSIQYVITNNSSGAGLEVTMAVSEVTS